MPAVTTSPAQALADLRVVDVTDLRGALCARLLADLGADVVRVQPPDLDPAVADGSAHRFRNANKRAVTLDLRGTEGRERLHQLLEHADALVENLGVGEAAAHGVDADEIAAAHPHLIHVAIGDFGRTGPRAGWRLEPLPAFASSGALHASGFPDLPPCWLPGFLAHDCASVFAAVGAIAAWMDRRRTGRGQLVDVSVQEAALSGTNPWSIILSDYVRINPLLPIDGRRNADATYYVLPAGDGHVRAVLGSERHWQGFLDVLGRPDALEGDEWMTPGFRIMNADVIRLVAQEALLDRTRQQVFEQALAAGTPMGVVHTLSEFVGAEQTRARGFFSSVGPAGDTGPFAEAAWKLDATPARVRRPAPAPGADDGGFDPRVLAAPTGAGGLLLDGVRVVEFGVAAVVPEMCWLLSELGAEVIKIESRAHPDVLRQTGGADLDCGFAYNAECRGRENVALDLTTERGRELAYELCVGADIVAENNRGGVMDAWGLGADVLRAANPRLIYVGSQGYGRGGPFGEMQAFGPLNSAFAGTHLLWNHADSPYPCGTSLNHPDHIAGKLLAIAVLAALDHRNRTGAGQLIDMAQTEAAAYLMGDRYLEAGRTGVDPVPNGNRSDHQVPHDVYPAAGDDRWIAIAVPDDAAYRRLVDALGWDGPGDWARVAGRLAARAEIDERLAEWTRSRDPDEATALLQGAGVSAMTVQGPVDHHADPHLAARQFIVELEHPAAGPEHHVGNPIRFGRTAVRTAGPSPRLGADTEAVLARVLGLAADEIADLIDRGVCR